MTKNEMKQGVTKTQYGDFVANSSMNGHPNKSDDDVMEYHYKNRDFAERVATRINRAEGTDRRYVEKIQITFTTKDKETEQ